MATAVGNLAIRLSVDSTGMVSGMARGAGEVKSFGAGLTSTFTTMTSGFAAAGGAAVGFAGKALEAVSSVAGLAKEFLGLKTGLAGLNVGVEFEREMSIVNAMTDATSAEFEALREEARRLGRDTEFTAAQAAQAMSQLAQHGFKIPDILGATKGVVNLASVLKVDIPQAAIIASDALGGFGMHADQIQRVNDVIASMMTGANTGGAEAIADAFKYVATTSQLAGKSIEETSAALMVLNNAGIKGSEAGSALSRFMTKMAKQTPQAQEAMDKLGLSFEDAAGNFKDFGVIFDELHGKLKDMGKAERLELISKIFDVRAGRAAGVFGALEDASKQYRANLKRLDQAEGTAGKIAGKQLMNVWGAIKIVQSSWEGLIETVYAGGQGGLKGGIDALTTVFNAARDVAAKTLPQIGAALKPLEAPLQRLGQGIMDNVLRLIPQIGKDLARFAEAAAPALARMVTAAADLVSQGSLLTQTWQTAISVGEGLVKISAALAGASGADGMSISWKKLGRTVLEMMAIVEFAWSHVTEFAELGLKASFVPLAEFSDKVTNVFTYIGDLAEWLGQTLEEAFKAPLSNAKDNFANFGESLKNFLKDPAQGFKFEWSPIDPNKMRDQLNNMPGLSDAASFGTIKLKNEVEALDKSLRGKAAAFWKDKVKDWAGEVAGPGAMAVSNVTGVFAGGLAALGMSGKLRPPGAGNKEGVNPWDAMGTWGDPAKKEGPLHFAAAAFQGSKEAVAAEMRFRAEGGGRGGVPEKQLEQQRKMAKALDDLVTLTKDQRNAPLGDVIP